MKIDKLWPLLAALALVACQSRLSAPPPTRPLPTISALLPTTLAAYQLPRAATQVPSSTPVPSTALSAYPAPVTVTSVPFTPLPPAPVIGQHIVQAGETIFCIARGYGVLPAAIAQANGLSQTFFVSNGQVLRIPAVQWTNIAAGSVCAPQFQSPFPGLPVLTATAPAYPAAVGAPLTVRLNWNCIANCASKTGDYVIRLYVLASGGVLPYTYNPGQIYDLNIPHCLTGQGAAAVHSADGQTARAAWTYADVACP